MTGNLYFHSPCFDGIVSAALIWEFMEARRGWKRARLVPVNYHLRKRWLNLKLDRPAVVVDFLYHPHTDFWADHHPTAFLTDEVRADFERREGANFVYEQVARSCAGVIWRHLHAQFRHRNGFFEELVGWAEKLDSATYESDEEALYGQAAAIQINTSLMAKDREGYSERLVEALREQTLDEVAARPDVKFRFREVDDLMNLGADRLKEVIYLDDEGYACFDVDITEVRMNRYAPFLFYPDARYAIGLSRWGRGITLRAMRNPWQPNPSVHLGHIFEQFDGGGHERVGTLVLRGNKQKRATELFETILAEIKSQDVF